MTGSPAPRPVRAALGFTVTARYTPFRRHLSRRAFGHLWWAAKGVLPLVGAMVGIVVGVVAGRLLQATPTDLGLALGMLALGNAMVTGAFLLSQLTGPARDEVARPSNVALFRAIDLPVRAAYVAQVVVPYGRFLSSLLVGNAIALAIALPALGGGPGNTWVATLPVPGVLVAAAFVGRASTRPRRRGSAALAGPLLRLLGLVALGAILAVTARGASRGSRRSDLSWLARHDALWWAASVVALGLSIAWLTWVWRRLAGRGYVDTPPDGSRARAGSRIVSSAAGRAAREFWAHPTSRLILTGARVLAGVSALALGAASVGVRVSDTWTDTFVLPASNGYAFVTFLVLVGLTFAVVGPTTTLPRLRWEWENSDRRAWTIAAHALTFHLLVVTPPALLVAAAQTALTGHLSLRPLAVGWGLVAAATIAETIVPARVRTDGTTAPGPLAAVAVLLLVSPTLIPSRSLDLWQCAGALLLIGAAVTCLRHRILVHPSISSHPAAGHSTSGVSRSATAATTSRSSTTSGSPALRGP